MLSRTLEGMWASEHLTRRCKLLMLAVIARGLSCGRCARDLTPALAAEGLDGAALDGIAGLGHIVLTVGLVFFFINLGKRIPSSEGEREESLSAN